MSVGRAAAQASHASNAFIHKYGCRSEVKEWQKQTNQGFGTAIVLSVSFDMLWKLYEAALDARCPTDKVVDPDYVFTMNAEQFALVDPKKINYRMVDETDPMTVHVSKQEVTCAYIFIDRKLAELYPPHE